ncbi:hypothetical protein QBC46DRAFT_385397 [Diplogelasinospora grovesii]|uniref:Uncharacterized protein n=1 Tax=Diplogelasinospora grovesii TaxID=303347 RepID=A0AAN6N7U5_9PEZI|nr:hypothetical protein QBC46DRAFT_385397 [Diplogelasinospora grovesii]
MALIIKDMNLVKEKVSGPTQKTPLAKPLMGSEALGTKTKTACPKQGMDKSWGSGASFEACQAEGLVPPNTFVSA